MVLKTGVMAAEITGIIIFKKNIEMQNSYFKLQYYFRILIFFTVLCKLFFTQRNACFNNNSINKKTLWLKTVLQIKSRMSRE